MLLKDHTTSELLEAAQGLGVTPRLARRLQSRYALGLAEVVPSDPDSPSTTIGVAEAAAAEIERRRSSPEPIVMALGTGRTL